MGVVYSKDFISMYPSEEVKTPILKVKDIMRPPFFVPESHLLVNLFSEMKQHKDYLAVVVDEYGGTSGIITMTDILEEIVGDISDEYDEDIPLYTLQSDGSYLFDGKTPLVDFLRVVNIPEKDFDEILEDVDTLAGLILELNGTFPKQKESFKYLTYEFQAEEMNKRRIVKVRYIPPLKGTSE